MIEFVKREDYLGKDSTTVAKEFEKILDDYKESLESMTVEQAIEEEKLIGEHIDKWNGMIKDIKYTLPKEVVNVAGVKVSRTQVGKYICDTLNKIECDYPYTLGYYQIWKWWKSPKSEIEYNMLNSTLQTLGSNIKYKGPAQWEAILTINEYFKPNHNEYAIDNMISFLYASIHSALIDKQKMEAPIKSENQQQETEVIMDGTKEELMRTVQ